MQNQNTMLFHMNAEVFAYHSIKNRHEILTKSLYAYRLFSPNSTDLNPVDDAGACVPDQSAWHWRAATASYITVWCELEQRIVDDAIDQRRRRLLACVDAEGGHFEHSL